MATSCRYEFQLQHFGFTDANPELFRRLQWTANKWIFFFYRFFMAGYVVAWFLVSYIDELSPTVWTLLSNWTEGVMVVYFLYSFIISIHSLFTRSNDDISDSAENLSWYYKINWLLYTVASTSAFEITLFYAFAIAPGRTLEQNLKPTTFHIHVINSVLLLIDIFMVAFPDRFLHFIYTISYGLLYTVFILILHFTGFTSAVYSLVDFANNPGTAVIWLVLAVIVMPFALHTLIFGFYHLRAFIERKTVLKYKSSPEKAEIGAINVSFVSFEEV